METLRHVHYLPHAYFTCRRVFMKFLDELECSIISNQFDIFHTRETKVLLLDLRGRQAF